MEELRNQITDLEIQEADIERQLQHAETDEEARQITNDLNLVRNRLSEKREELRIAEEKEQARAEVIEEKAHSAEIPFAVAGIDFTGLAPEVITLIDLVVKADRRRMLNEHAIEIEQLDQQINNQNSVLNAITGDLVARTETMSMLMEENYQLTLEKEDAEKKRDAAIREKEEAQIQLQKADAELQAIRAEIEDYKRAQEYNNRQTEQVTANDEEKANISAAIAAVKKLYVTVEDWGSVQKVIKEDGSFELATRQQVQEEWSPVDVPSFRPEDTDADAQSDQLLITETAATVEPPAFREEEPAVQGEHVLHGTVASEAVGQDQPTWEEWVERAISDLQSRLSVFEVERGYGKIMANPPKRDAA